MQKYMLFAFLLMGLVAFGQKPTLTGTQILEKLDQNMDSKNRVSESEMVIQGRRQSRTVRSKSYSVGTEKSLTEYLSPEREKGTKMLKLDDRLWIYSPTSDRTIQLSGHMLKQSVMGSDLSYEDMMETRSTVDMYDASISGEEAIDGNLCWIIELNAKVDDAAYEKMKMWIDQDKFVPRKQEMYAKSGSLLKIVSFSDVQSIEGRWFPMRMIYKDALKDGKGTEFIFHDISFDVDIPEYLFNKASLTK